MEIARHFGTDNREPTTENRYARSNSRNSDVPDCDRPVMVSSFSFSMAAPSPAASCFPFTSTAPLITWIQAPRFSSLPVLVKISGGLNVVITESDLLDYAGMDLTIDAEPNSLQFLSAVPTAWDETPVLNARIGEYILLARRNGKEWYVGAMTNWTPRDLELDLSFLGNGSYQADIYRDGPNADRVGVDYQREKRSVKSSERLGIHLAPGGGWAARIEKVR